MSKLKNEIAVRGQSLLWHRSKWFALWLNDHDFDTRKPSEAERLLTTPLRTVMRRYPGISSFDVVNQAIMPETGGLEATSRSNAGLSESNFPGTVESCTISHTPYGHLERLPE